MKRCPTCQRTFTDETQKFCANDGTPLVNDEPAFDPEATVMSLGNPLSDEEPSSPTPPSSPQPPPTPPYYNPGAGSPSQPEQNIHQSSPPPAPTPGALPTWQPPQQQQQQQPHQPYYPHPGMPGGQTPPQWQGGPPPQQQQPPWMPPGQQQPQGQWGGGGGYNQPGQYAPYGATPAATGGTSKAATFSLILGIISFFAIVALFIIIGARIRDLRDLIEPLGWLSLATGVTALILGIVGLIISKKTSSKVKAGIGIFLGIIPLIFFFIGLANRL